MEMKLETRTESYRDVRIGTDVDAPARMPYSRLSSSFLLTYLHLHASISPPFPNSHTCSYIRSVMQMDPLQRPVHALAQVLAAYLSCLPARVTSGLAQRQHHSAEDDVEADSVNAGASNKSSNSSGSGNARSQKASSECEPVREVLRALGAVFHLEFTGHASLLDEAAWRSLLIACGHVGGAGMRRLAVRYDYYSREEHRALSFGPVFLSTYGVGLIVFGLP